MAINSWKKGGKAGLQPDTQGDPPSSTPPLLIRAMVWLHAVFLLGIVLALTTQTQAMDDVKKLIFFATGPALLLLGILSYALRLNPLPPRFVFWSFAGFAAVLIVSTFASAFRWIAFDEGMMYYCAGGFMLSAMAIASHRRSCETFFRYLVLLLLVTNLIGAFMYDFAESDPATGSLVAWVYRRLITPETLDMNRWWHALLYTFAMSDGAMQSTVISRDYYAGFCILLLPFALLMTIDPGPSRRPRFWRIVGGMTTLLTVICVIKTQSKGEYVFGILTLAFFLGTISFIEDFPVFRSRFIVSLVSGIFLVVFSVLWMMKPVLVTKLKSMDTSMGSREVIWKGSMETFEEHPIFGGGPAAFRIRFPNHRPRDYFEHELSNVTEFSHNYFLDLLCETGVLGCGLYVFGLLAIGWLGLRTVFRSPEGRIRVRMLAALCGLLAIYGSNMTSPNARWAVCAAAMYTVLGLTIGMLAQSSAGYGAKPAGTPGHPLIRALFYGMIIIVAAAMPVYGLREGRRFYISRTHYLGGVLASAHSSQMLEKAKAPLEMVQKSLEESAAEFVRSIEWDPYNYQSMYQLGTVYTDLSNIEWGRLAALLRESTADRAQIAARAALMNVNLRKALTQYDSISRLWPDYAEIHYNYGLLYGRIAQDIRVLAGLGIDGDFKEHSPAAWEQMALDESVRMAALSSRDQVQMLLGRQYSQKGMFGQAVEVYRQAAQAVPLNEALLREYQDAALRAGDVVAQCDALEKLGNLRPLDDTLLDMLLMLADAKRQEPLLLRAIDRLEALNPIDPRIAQYRFFISLREGRRDLALVQLDRYLKSGGRDARLIELARQAAVKVGKGPQLDQLLREDGITSPTGKS